MAQKHCTCHRIDRQTDGCDEKWREDGAPANTVNTADNSYTQSREKTDGTLKQISSPLKVNLTVRIVALMLQV